MSPIKMKCACLLGFLCVASAPCFGDAGCVSPPADMVAWWPGDGDTSDIAGGFDGALVHEATFEEGFIGEAFSFDGIDDYVTVPHDESLHPTDAITVLAWINARSLVSCCDPVVKKCGREDSSGYALEYSGSFPEEVVAFWVNIEALGWVSGPHGPAPVNEWNFVAGTYDGSEISLFVNGHMMEPPVFAPGKIVFSSEELNIGHTPGLDWESRFFHGLIDEVAIWDRALAADELQAIYEAGQGGLCRGAPFRRGDADNSGLVNITDAIFALNHLFLGGPAPGCADAADANDDGALQITDAIYLLGGLFLGGPPLPAPTGSCGTDPTEDALGCESFQACP